MRYVVEPLALGWFCRNETCGVFNGDEKVFLTECRTCGSARPRRPDSFILARMELEDIDEEEAEYRTWIDVYGEKIGHVVAVEEAKKMRERGEFGQAGTAKP